MTEHEFSLICWSDHPTIVFGEEEYVVADYDIEHGAVYVIDGNEGMWLHYSLIQIQNA